MVASHSSWITRWSHIRFTWQFNLTTGRPYFSHVERKQEIHTPLETASFIGKSDYHRISNKFKNSVAGFWRPRFWLHEYSGWSSRFFQFAWLWITRPWLYPPFGSVWFSYIPSSTSISRLVYHPSNPCIAIMCYNHRKICLALLILLSTKWANNGAPTLHELFEVVRGELWSFLGQFLGVLA